MAITKIKFPRIDVASLISSTTGNQITTGSDGKLLAQSITTATKTSELTNDGEDGSHPFVTQQDIDAAVSSVYKPAGSVAFANLPTLSSSVLGNVYNVTDAFTTTSDFVEGSGSSYPAGTNVVVVNTGTSGSPTYKFDVLSGLVDLSGYQTKLTAGSNITISNDTISATDTTYTAGSGLTLSSGAFSLDLSALLAHQIINEAPSGNIDGSNTAFSLANTPISNTLQVFLNGQLLVLSNDYTLANSTITMVDAPLLGDSLRVNYWKV